MKKNKKKKKSSAWRWWTLLVVAVVATILLQLTKREPESIQRTQAELQERYDYNLNHRTPTNVHPFLRSVYFSRGKYAAACGTMIFGRDGKESYIVTANHLFSQTEPGSDYYDYHVLEAGGFTSQGHLYRVVLDSMRTSSTDEGIQDVAFCYMGEANLIPRTSRVIVSASSPSQHDFVLAPVAPFKVTSITTGEQFEIIGEAVNSVTNAFYLMLYESVSGESGSGFWKDEGRLFPGGGGKLYVLSGDIRISEQTRRELKIPSKYKRLTPMSAIQINW